MMNIQKLLNRRLCKNEQGISAVEFGLIAPVAMVMLMGVMDIGHNYYVRIVLNGVMQDASRSSSLESVRDVIIQDKINLRVNDTVKAVIPTAFSVDEQGRPIAKDPKLFMQQQEEYQEALAAWEAADPDTRGEAPNPPDPNIDTIVPERRFYKTFSEAAAAQAEEWNDANEDGDCNNGEAYVDENANETWDADGGDDGFGAAHDVVVMKVRIRYKRLFPTASLLGFSEDIIAESDSVLANQPYAERVESGPVVVRSCVDDV